MSVCVLDDQCASLLDHFFDGVYVVDGDRKILYWNKSAEKITGYLEEEMLGMSCADNRLRHVTNLGEPLCERGCPLLGTIHDCLPRSAEVYLHHKFGHRVPVQIRAHPLYDKDGLVCGAVEIFSDNTRQEMVFRQLKDLERSLYQDALTGVGNRKFAEVRLSELMGAWRDHGQPFGVLFVDIDHFKQVNDTYGHQTGDKIIQLVARTLQNGLRPTDRVFRFGGEEFLCLLPGTDHEGMGLAAERLRALVERSWLDTVSGALRVTVSIGGAISGVGETADVIVEQADQQMYKAKMEGRNRTCIASA